MAIKITKKVNAELANKIKKLLTMTGEEIYATYGIKRDENISETVCIPSSDYQVDIKLCMPLEPTEIPWTEAVLFKNGREVAFSEPSDEFFGPWYFEIEDAEYEITLEPDC